MSKTAELQKKLAVVKNKGLVQRTFRHYKGGIYLVDGLVVDTDDGEIRILYHRVDGPGFNARAEADIRFVRPIAEWFDMVDDKPRFEQVERTQSWTIVQPDD